MFRSPWNNLKHATLFDYFRNRESVHYFPVIDDMECDREKIDRILDDCFTFNFETYPRTGNGFWLTNPSSDREWLFMLHKFYYAVGLGKAYQETSDDRYAKKWIELTDSWIADVTLDFLPSRVAGRRIQNWIYAHWYFVTSTDISGMDPDFYLRFLISLHDQVNHLLNHLDRNRNHRTLELSAIFLASTVFPEFIDAPEWREAAIHYLQENLSTDLLPDGVHCELSSMYHNLVLKNYLVIMRLAKLNGIDMPEQMHVQIRQALDFALYLHKPDGSIPALSDSDMTSYLGLLRQGYELYHDEAFLYVSSKGESGSPPPVRSKGFSVSGYYILRSGWGNKSEAYQDCQYLIMDCGPLGAGNHGHFDALHFELAAFGQSLIVDPGRYTYDESGEYNWRAWFRGSAAHNLVVIDNQNQTRYEYCEVAKKFQTQGLEPEVKVRSFISRDRWDYLHAEARSHQYAVIHQRKVLFACPTYWIVSDRLIANTEHQYDLLFHLPPNSLHQVVSENRNGTLLVSSPNLLFAQPQKADVQLYIEQGHVAPTYGLKQAAPVIRFSCIGRSVSFYTILFPYKKEPPCLEVIELPVFATDSNCVGSVASAFKISIRHENRAFQDICFLQHGEKTSEFSCLERNYRQEIEIVRTDVNGTSYSVFSA